MQKNTVLLLFLLMLILTGCTGERKTPAEPTTTDIIPKKEPSQQAPENPRETTAGSIELPPENSAKDDDGENGEATEDPKETLTKILTELQELDELINGTD